MKRPNVTGAALMLAAVVAGMAGGAIAVNAAAKPVQAPPAVTATLHQVADEATPTPAPPADPAPAAADPALAPDPAPAAADPAPAPAAPTTTESASAAADRAEKAADRADKAADRASTASQEAPAPTPAPVVEHTCAAGLTWDEHGDGGEPGCIHLACPDGQKLQRESNGKPYCAAIEPTEVGTVSSAPSKPYDPTGMGHASSGGGSQPDQVDTVSSTATPAP